MIESGPPLDRHDVPRYALACGVDTSELGLATSIRIARERGCNVSARRAGK